MACDERVGDAARSDQCGLSTLVVRTRVTFATTTRLQEVLVETIQRDGLSVVHLTM